MSIILRALKKIQEQKAAAQPDVSESESRSPAEQPVEEMASVSEQAPAVAEDEVEIRDVPEELGQQDDDRAELVSSPVQEASHRFSVTPKVFLGVMIVLGVFTVGWFTNRIYISLKSSPRQEHSISGADAETPRLASVSPEPVSVEAVASVPPSPQLEPVAVTAPLPAKENKPLPATSSEALVETVSSPSPPPQQPAPVTVPALPPAAQAPARAVSPPIVKEPEQEAVPASQPAPPQQTASSPAPSLPSNTPVPSTPQPVSPAEQTQVPPPPVARTERPAPQSSSLFRKDAEPTRKKRPELKINAIAWQAKEPKAIVNMQRVYVGDEIEGATVLAIQRKVILFEYEGKPFEVRF